MKAVQDLHREAMSLADLATMEQVAGNRQRAHELLEQAFEKERRAAELLDARFDLEPTRSVLFRSAASLALDAGHHGVAEKLICRALIGSPPPEIADELRDLLENVNFTRHLELRGHVLEPNEFQLSIAGSSVAYGMAESGVFVGRVQDVERLVGRTVERRAKKPFRERGRPDGAITRPFSTFLSMPRPASFAVTFRVGYAMQLQIPGLGLDSPESVVSDMLECLGVLSSDRPRDIEKLIPDPAYRRNFVALARRLAPDGKDVKTVGFTAAIGGTVRQVAMTRTADQMISPGSIEQATSRGVPVTVQGTLRFADSMKPDHNEIRLVDEKGKSHRIKVPVELMDDIVRPLWHLEVRVEGYRQGSKIHMTDCKGI